MENEKMNKGEIIIYHSDHEGPKLEVQLENETVWLTQAQMAKLFGKTVPTINEHIKNIYEEQELKNTSTIRKFRIVQNEKGRAIERSLEHYNLDVIISVGYRVKSRQGTQFRIWANKVLRDYLVKGYALNQQRLLEQQKAFKELQSAIKFIKESSSYELLESQRGELLRIVDQYAESLSLLYQYDEGKLNLEKGGKAEFVLDCDQCYRVILELKQKLFFKNEAGELFGRENGEKLRSIIGNLYQSYGGEELYPSLKEKAAHLLYFVIKDHPFYDGNKRIASMLFVYFLRQNGISNIDGNTLVALALLVAISSPKDKDVMVKIVTNLIK